MKRRIIGIIIFIIGLVLFIDELWMFGVPFGPILPDMSVLHIEPFHHWMLGVLLMVIGGACAK